MWSARRALACGQVGGLVLLLAIEADQGEVEVAEVLDLLVVLAPGPR